MDMIKDLSGFRMDYDAGELLESEVNPNPYLQFLSSLEEALYLGLYEPYSMSLATADAKGRPHTRILLLRGASEQGYEFYTNYESQKAKDLAENPYAEMLFFWGKLQTQVRIFGRVEKVTREESIEYFHKRPRESQIGAHVSQPQSAKIESRELLLQRLAEMQDKFSDESQEIPKPEQWGGYRLIPEYYEFWQGRPARVHDRIIYEKQENGEWLISRLMP